ncbi:hypothetical protein [Halostagnicola kamekurae]|uniref:hypothetical protein n=1 Tax=Halostagnicola kamekurae TaxID=619731 RepID=UPI0015879FE0|nr:hypothetical protein [Halostagnicola kamekurae]
MTVAEFAGFEECPSVGALEPIGGREGLSPFDGAELKMRDNEDSSGVEVERTDVHGTDTSAETPRDDRRGDHREPRRL